MKRCKVRPYEGTEKYIFISYCHKDKMFVFPIIEQLRKDGYRIWYDEGVDPGSEWPEIIASHLNGCAACIAFITENSLNSHNCRREINFALLKKKPFVSIILENVKMSLGMEMQLSATQSIFKYKLPTDAEFFEKLYEAKFLRESLGQQDASIVVSTPEAYKENAGTSDSQSELKRDSFSDKWFLNKETVEEKVSEPEPEKTEQKRTTHIAWLIREKTNEKIELQKETVKLGRSSERCDYVIEGNSTIGRLHAIVRRQNSEYVVVDNDSKNKTYLNGDELEANRPYNLKNGDSIKLVNERFTFYSRLEEDV